MNKVLIIIGPTATGKTDLALGFAKSLNGEIISCDSRQVYRGLDIGTGKMPAADFPVEKHDGYWIIDGIKIWMYDVADPKNRYTAADYVEKTKEVLKTISLQKKLSIICGGTGLYLKLLLEGISHVGISPNRSDLEKLSLEQLQSKVQQQDLEKWEELTESDKKNSRRLIRLLEITDNAKNLNSHPTITGIGGDYDILQIGLMSSKETLKQKINNRLAKRFLEGMIEEARVLHQNGLTYQRMAELGLEYKFLAQFLNREIASESELVELLRTKIYQYAKRQITWFKKRPNINWFSIEDSKFLSQVELKVLDWYNI